MFLADGLGESASLSTSILGVAAAAAWQKNWLGVGPTTREGGTRFPLYSWQRLGLTTKSANTRVGQMIVAEAEEIFILVAVTINESRGRY